MNRRRGEDKNWYRLAITERARQMEDHGNIGQRYAGKVKQIISGSVGFDDWEWGVDLFADDPVIFKKLTMRCASTKSARHTPILGLSTSACAARLRVCRCC